MYQTIQACRVCGNPRLEPSIDLGEQALTGVFPRSREQQVATGPLRLVKCHGPDACGLVQLRDSFQAEAMYGANYGYRSGLNASMVRHLHDKVKRILSLHRPAAGGVVLDIGSNDGTTLSAYPSDLIRIGIDPTAKKFREFYPPDVRVVTEFFSAASFRAAAPEGDASIVTSFSMFYDLERPLDFMREVRSILAPDGVWIFEQSYLPLMLETNSYDTICHEHLEYYALAQIDWMTRKTGLKIIDIEFNAVNGGSFSVTVAKRDDSRPESPQLAAALARERELGIDSLECYANFAKRVEASRDALRAFADTARSRGQSIAGLGASTKGNVLLQYCGFTQHDIQAIGEINRDKIGSFTPGSLIPIVDEQQLVASAPDFLLVLPWHFRQTFYEKALQPGSKLLFPLPELEVASARS